VSSSEWLILIRTDRSSPVTSSRDKATWFIISLLCACGGNANSGIILDYVIHQKSLDGGIWQSANSMECLLLTATII